MLRQAQGLFERRNWLAEFVAPNEDSLQYPHTANIDKHTFTSGRMKGKYELFEFLLSRMPEEVRGMSWLEVGCCDGANLLVLRKLGVENLSGFEINPDFLEAGKCYDKEAVGSIKTSCSSAEDYFAGNPEACDVIFSCAVLQHINPASSGVFSSIAELARKYVITIEAEMQCNRFHYPRNYARIFSALGYEELESALIEPQLYPGVESNYLGYMIRILKKL